MGDLGSNAKLFSQSNELEIDWDWPRRFWPIANQSRFWNCEISRKEPSSLPPSLLSRRTYIRGARREESRERYSHIFRIKHGQKVRRIATPARFSDVVRRKQFRIAVQTLAKGATWIAAWQVAS